mgnify:CR=1 FL=1
MSPDGTIAVMNSARRINLLLAFCTVILMIGIGEYVARFRAVPRLFPDNTIHQKLGRSLPAGKEVVRPCDDICKSQKHNTFLTFNNIGHLNPNGHRIGAEELFALLRERGLVRVE